MSLMASDEGYRRGDSSAGHNSVFNFLIDYHSWLQTTIDSLHFHHPLLPPVCKTMVMGSPIGGVDLYVVVNLSIWMTILKSLT
jgi:hypothetical protein